MVVALRLLFFKMGGLIRSHGVIGMIWENWLQQAEMSKSDTQWPSRHRASGNELHSVQWYA